MNAEKDFQVFLRLANSEDRRVNSSSDGKANLRCRISAGKDAKTVLLQPVTAENEQNKEVLAFDTVFTPDDDNAAVYHGAARGIVESTLLGYHGTIIAIGDDLSGSSSTLREAGPPAERSGVILRAAEQIFRCVKRSRAKTGARLVVLCSHVAVVEDECFDLLASLTAIDKNSQPPRLQFEGGHLHGLSLCQATSTKQVKSFLAKGQALMQKIEEGKREASRLSHSAFMFTVEHAQFGSSFSPVSGTLTIVDVGYRVPSTDAVKCDSSLDALLRKIAQLSGQNPEHQTQVLSSNVGNASSSPSSEDDALLLQILGGALGGNCRTALICHAQEQLNAADGTWSLLSLVSNASHISNTPNKRDLAERALMAAYLRELGITRMVLEKEKDPRSKEQRKMSPRGHVASPLASASETKLRDVEDQDEYVDGRHLLHKDEPDGHVTGSDVTATSEGNHATEAIASALAAAALDKEEVSSSESEEEEEVPPLNSSQERHALHQAQLEERTVDPAAAANQGDVKGTMADQPSPQPKEVSSAEQHLEDKHLKLKSGKRRTMHKDERSPCVAVQDACLGSEAFTIEVLLGLLQDPDHGAHRAQVSKDVLIRKDFGGLFSGVSIVQWMMETLDGISSEEEAASLGQLLLDKRALVHSEGSSVFAGAESLFYYARIGRAGPNGLSEVEIQRLLGQSQVAEGTVTKVDPSSPSPGQLQEARDGGGSGAVGTLPTTWNRTDVVGSKIDDEKEGGEKATWNSTDMQPHLSKGKPTSWNVTSVDHVGEEHSDGVEVGSAGEVVGGANQRPTTADRLNGSRGKRKKHKKEGHRRDSANSRRGTRSTEDESFATHPPAASWEDDGRIRFYNDREEVPPPPLTAESLISHGGDDNDYLHGNYQDLHASQFRGNHGMYPVQESDESTFADEMGGAVGVDGAYLGSIPNLDRHQSMLLGTEKGDWSASQLFMYESQLALTGLDQSQLEMTGPGPAGSGVLCEAGGHQQGREKKAVNKYSAKPSADTLKTMSEDRKDLQSVSYPTPLHMQAATGPPQKGGVLRELIMMYGVNTTDTLGRSPLMFAILGNKLPACSVLIDCGATVDQPAENCITPLHLAAYVGNKEAVSLLLRKGATVGLKDSHGRNALHYSTVPESPACLQLLLRSAYDSVTNATDESLLLPIHWAIAKDHYRHVAVLMKKGAMVEGTDQQGRTCLNYAICCSAINSFEVLLSAHPDLLSLPDSTLTTPLHLACAHPSTKFLDTICKISQASGLDVNCGDNIDRSPLHYAAICDRLPAVKELLKRGADRNIVDKKGRTALDYALRHGEESEIVQLLQSSNPSSSDCRGSRKNRRSAFCDIL